MASIRKIQGKKGISYKVEISCGYDKNGKKIRETTTYVPEPGMTAKQAEKAARKFADEFEDRVKTGNRISGDKTTLNDFVEEWFKPYAENQLERTTLRAGVFQDAVPFMGRVGRRPVFFDGIRPVRHGAIVAYLE